MIVENFEQGSDEWFEARLGIPTASCFSKIITSTGKKSTQASAYMNKLVAESLIGSLEGIEKTVWMERGNLLEAEARELYEFDRCCDVEEVGIVYKDEKRLISCSPDGFIKGSRKGLEIKCPKPETHVSYLLSGKLPTAYVAQVQGSMFVTGFDEWDFMSYHPEMPPLIITVKRDNAWHEAFDAIINDFISNLQESKSKLKELTK